MQQKRRSFDISNIIRYAQWISNAFDNRPIHYDMHFIGWNKWLKQKQKIINERKKKKSQASKEMAIMSICNFAWDNPLHFNDIFNVLPHYSAFYSLRKNPHSIKIKFIAIFRIYDHSLCGKMLFFQLEQKTTQPRFSIAIEQDAREGEGGGGAKKMLNEKLKKQIEKQFTLQTCCP